MKKNINTGKIGEAFAAEYLANKGFQILEQNWIYNHKEIDIIAQDEDILVIVEVKSRNQTFVDPPGEVVTKKKQRNLIAAANNYVEIKNILQEIRFDVVTVSILPRKIEIDHIKEAFYPGY